ncbi:MAG: DUF3857 and transglutaminase domain-containing protein [Planctomycetes bacterium]|nr:DUF3857 and transglutaminase domain-containing protein [Planctomycetota bacterium]
MNRLVTTLLLLLLAGAAAAQEANDVLYLQDGRERVGELHSLTADEVVFLVRSEDTPRSFARAAVQRIELSRRRAGDDARRAEELHDPLLDRLLAQAPSKMDHPDSGHITLYQLDEYTLHRDGGYTHRERQVQKVLLERGKRLANVARYYKKGEETLEIDFARTIDTDGSVISISDAAVDITSINADTPEYEKLYQVKFARKQVSERSVLDFQVTWERRETDLLEPFYATEFFRASEPILEKELRIIVPAGVELAQRSDRLGDNVEFSRSQTDAGTVYRWVARDCPRVVPESLMPPAGDLYPRVTAAGKTTWTEIGAAYSAALRQAGEAPPAVQAKVGELIAGATDPEDKARRIFDYFTREIRRQYVAPSSYSYAPRPIGDVFAKLAGNAIDKAALLRAMLVEAGLPAGVVLVCPQDYGKLVEDVPCIRQFSDTLVAVTLPSGRQFLPLNRDTVRFGQMPEQYQGTRGLLVTDTESELVTVPLHKPPEEQFASTYRIRVTPSGDLTVNKTETLTGTYEMSRRAAWKDLKDEELRREFEMELTAMHAKAHLLDYSIQNLHDLTQPLGFTQSYTLERYAMRAGDDLLVFRLPEIEYGAGSVGKPTRDFPLRWQCRALLTTDMHVEIPPGFRIYYAGKDFQAECDVVSFAASFNTGDNEIHYHDEFVQRGLEAPAEEYAAYKKCIETKARVPKEWIVLERVNE